MKKALFLLAAAACTTSSTDVPIDASDNGQGSAACDPVTRSGTRLQVQYMKSDDGMRVPLATFRDVSRDENCSPQIAADGTRRCLPAFITANSFFADAFCTIPAASVEDCAAPPAYVAVATPFEACVAAHPGPRIYEVGTQYTSAYRFIGTTCTATGETPGTVYYSAGDEVPASEFASVTVASE